MPAGLSLAPFQQYLRAPEPTYIELDMSTRPAQRAELKALGAGYDAQRQVLLWRRRDGLTARSGQVLSALGSRSA